MKWVFINTVWLVSPWGWAEVPQGVGWVVALPTQCQCFEFSPSQSNQNSIRIHWDQHTVWLDPENFEFQPEHKPLVVGNRVRLSSAAEGGRVVANLIWLGD